MHAHFCVCCNNESGACDTNRAHVRRVQAPRAGAIGAIYEASGRATSYTVAAIVMIVFVVAGMWLAKDFWRSNRHRDHAPEPQRVTARRRDR